MKTAAKSIIWMTLALMVMLSTFLLQGASLGGMEEKVTAAAPEVQFAPGELLVKFKGMSSFSRQDLDGIPDQDGAFFSMLPSPAFDAMEKIRGEVVRISTMTGWVQVRFSADIPVGEAVKVLEQSGAVEWAEPNYRIQGASAPPIDAATNEQISRAPAAAPGDPRFTEQWGLNNTGQTGGEADADIDAVEAWNIRSDATSVIVAVLGTGIEYTHVDLAANMWKNPKETSCTNGVDDDANGYVDDCYGIDAYLNSGNPLDDHGQGTHMAGIVGAVGNNAKGVAGVGWKAKLMALKFLDSDGWGWSADAVQCIDYALKIKDKNAYPRMVILSALTGDVYSRAIYDAIVTAQTKGVLFVAGAGDLDRDMDVWPYYPAAFDLPNILSATGSTHTDWYGAGIAAVGRKRVDLAAPGENILSTWLDNTYKRQTTTSASAGFVAGACALTWAQNPAKNWKQIKGLILNGVEDGLHAAWYGRSMTEGRLNLKNSLTASFGDDPAIFDVTPEVTVQGETITLTGINFGATAKTITFKGYDFPASSIVSWANEKIVAKVPAACPSDVGRIVVTNAAGTSRGAYFRVGTGQWTNPTYQSVTLLQHEEAAYSQVGDDIWIFSGRSNYDQTSSVERFSLVTLRGEVRPEWEIPKAVRRAGAAAIGKKVYVVGGYDDWTNKYQAALQIFDTTTGAWVRGRNLPQPLDRPTVVSTGGKLYVFGGRSPNNTGLKTAYMYDPATNAWTAKKALPLKRAYAGAAVPFTNKIWLVSGYTESGGTWYFTKDVLEYNVTTNEWEIRDDIPLVGEHSGGGVVNIGSKVICLYGEGDWGAGEWISATSKKWIRNIARADYTGTYTPMLGKLGNTVYVISGSRARNVYKFTSQ